MLDIDMNSISLHLAEYKLEVVGKPKSSGVLQSLLDVLGVGNVCTFILNLQIVYKMYFFACLLGKYF